MDEIDNLIENAGFRVESSDDTFTKLKEETQGTNISVSENKKADMLANSLVTSLSNADRDQAVIECIVPKSYRDATFDVDKIKANAASQYVKTGRMYRLHKFNQYIGICESLLGAFRTKRLPERSYIIGAPNGFGKTSFVMESLITLRKQGYRVVPFISLWELAQIRVENEFRIKKAGGYRINNDDKVEMLGQVGTEAVLKKPIVVQNAFSFSEYINADCLFVQLTDIASKEIESAMLSQLLQIRGAKGLATIVLTSNALTAYTNDPKLKEYIWNEILDFNEDTMSLDRVYHISCYKFKSTSVDGKSENYEANTGIVD